MVVNLKDVSIEFNNKEITGVIDKDNILYKESIKDELNNNKYLISYINYKDFLTKTISDEFYLSKHITKDKDNYIEKIVSCLEMVGLSSDYLEKDIPTLSNSEKILLELATSLITNPDVIIFNNIFNNLDRKNKQLIKKILLELKKKYEKTIIIIDNNINILYEMCTSLVIFENNNLLIYDKVSNVFKDIDFLIDNNIEIPDLIKFSLIAGGYGKKINYYNNINDLIKDVYRNAR
ncbi:MAG: hypothetical protein IKN63_03870 [Bacilli bacterium]|nr:hypothetical protein [Bacilli bacterium]